MAGQFIGGGDFITVNESHPNSTDAIGPELLGWVLDEHAAALELYAGQLCDCAEDAVQSALIDLAVQAQKPRDVVAWLYRVVRNKALSASRATHRRKHREAVVAQGRAAWFEPGDESLDIEAVTQAVAGLAEEQRELVVARIWGGLSFQQLGELIGVSDSAAHRRYEAALDILRKELGVPCQKKN